MGRVVVRVDTAEVRNLYHCTTFRFEHAMNFVHHGNHVADMLKRVVEKHEVEGAVRKRPRRPVKAVHHVNTGEPQDIHPGRARELAPAAAYIKRRGAAEHILFDKPAEGKNFRSPQRIRLHVLHFSTKLFFLQELFAEPDKRLFDEIVGKKEKKHPQKKKNKKKKKKKKENK